MRTLESKTRLVSPNFITEIIEEDLRSGRCQKVVTRFPPEPNGYAHLGHAIASFIDFGIALDYGGECRLRMDDTNPETERAEYAEALIADMRWLGWDWGGRVRYASDYFEELYQMAEKLILKGLAYVDSVSPEEMARLRGTVDTPGTPSPYRNRSVEENLDLFRRMRAGEFKNGEHVLRAKIDLASPNMKLRDPVLYRIVHAEHYRTGRKWCIYPSYDFAQATTDALDGVTHSLCSLEFVDNRAIYDWLMDHLWGEPPLDKTPRPRQYEFGRRSLEYTVVSKRKLKKLVEGGYVQGLGRPSAAHPGWPAPPGGKARGHPPLCRPSRHLPHQPHGGHRPLGSGHPRRPEHHRPSGDGGAAAPAGGAHQPRAAQGRGPTLLASRRGPGVTGRAGAPAGREAGAPCGGHPPSDPRAGALH